MHRLPRPDDPRLETLLDERDHLKIQLSLAIDSDAPNEDRIRELRQAVSDVDSRIRTFSPRP